MGKYRYRYPLMLLAMLSLLAAGWAGLLRIGWSWPAILPQLPINHGALMVSGFFGTLIALERAVAMGKPWTYLSPLLSGIGGLVLIFDSHGSVGPLLLTAGSFFLAAVFIPILWSHLTGYMIVMASGAITLLVGNLLWFLGWPVYEIVYWWAGFLILTIAGERLELGRMVRLSRFSQLAFASVILFFLTGLILGLFNWDWGVRIAGIGILGLGIWLLKFDIARRTVKSIGLTRYIAVCLLGGYVWMLIAGILAIIHGGVPAGPIYDAMIHSIFLGFVFSMIFGHAPIIFPAVLGIDIQYKTSFYYPLVLLHASLVLRISGDLLGLFNARMWGGLINAIAVLAFIAMIVPVGRRSMGTLKA